MSEQKFTAEQQAQIDKLTNQKVKISGWIALAFAVVFFSGMFTGKEGIIGIFDYSNILGKFGALSETAKNVTGSGGYGVRYAFTMFLTIWPNVVFALAIMNVVEGQGGLLAAQKILNPILRPVLGVPGWCGLSLITGWLGSTDGGSALTLTLVDNGLITEKEHAIYSAWSYVGSCSIGQSIALAGIITECLAPGGISMGYIFIMYAISKIMVTNLMRLYVHKFEKPAKEVA